MHCQFDGYIVLYKTINKNVSCDSNRRSKYMALLKIYKEIICLFQICGKVIINYLTVQKIDLSKKLHEYNEANDLVNIVMKLISIFKRKNHIQRKMVEKNKWSDQE